MALVLFLIGLLLIIFNVLAEVREKTKTEDNNLYNVSEESSFMKTFDKTSKQVSNEQMEIIKIRKELAETVLELQKDIQDINIKIDKMASKRQNKITDSEINNTNKTNQKSNKITIKANKDIAQNLEKIENKVHIDENSLNMNVKIEDMQELINKGLSDEDISKQLHISKGEILLIKELYLK